MSGQINSSRVGALNSKSSRPRVVEPIDPISRENQFPPQGAKSDLRFEKKQSPVQLEPLQADMPFVPSSCSNSPPPPPSIGSSSQISAKKPNPIKVEPLPAPPQIPILSTPTVSDPFPVSVGGSLTARSRIAVPPVQPLRGGLKSPSTVELAGDEGDTGSKSSLLPLKPNTVILSPVQSDSPKV